MKPHPGHVRRPSIGVTPDLTQTQSAHPAPAYQLKEAYAQAVLRAGGLPLVLPLTDDRQVIDAYLDKVSGLLVSGGAFDIPPAAYGEAPREGLGTTHPARTQFETLLIQGAMARQLPVLGICGGMQLLNVVLGGTLVQDIGREVTGARNHEQKNDRTQPSHPVEVKEGTLLAEMLGRGQCMVNSTHHQAVKKLAGSLRASALAPDGVVEAVEDASYPFAVGVQWHPEMLIDTVPPHLSIYKALVVRAREVRR